MLSRMRRQVQSILYAVPAKRKPALRRSDAVDALFATDLPEVAEEGDVRAFVETMEARGWTIRERNGWLTLDAEIDRPVRQPPKNLVGECGCCIAMLVAHEFDIAPEQEFVRAAVKAADAGREPFERMCARIHGILSARLKLHEQLPADLLPYLCYAHEKFYGKEGKP